MQVVDRRQFIIMKKPYVRADFKQIALTNGYILSYHEELRVKCNEGQGIYLLGNAFSVNSDGICLDENSLQNKRYWAGRWILIYKDQLYLDACGTLGCFYYVKENKELVLSSSLHLISEEIGVKSLDVYQVKHGDGHGVFDYYPAPHTIYEDVYKMLPTQFVSLGGDYPIKVREDNFQRVYTKKTREWIRNKIISCMKQELKNIMAVYGKEIWIPLTGGVDSRAVFVIAESLGLEFGTYTILRKNTKEWDIELPQKICDVLKREHLYLRENDNIDLEQEKLYFRHTSGCSVGTEKKQFLSGLDVPVKNAAIVLWGTGWASHIKHYYRYFASNQNAEEIMENMNAVCDGILEQSEIHQKSLTAWLNYVQENPIDGFEWRERLYFEQRVGSWESYAAQGFDMFDSERISPVNCQEILELLFSLDVKPGDKSIEVEIVEACCPEIMHIRYGERTDLLYRLKRKLRRVFCK